jgi:uncharacterized protein
MIQSKRTPNRLLNEKSPYLQQHAYNPVDWYPWSEEAFTKAKEEDKPIFLSIGYSTCYWCHVMEREVFENEQLAGLMNTHMVNVKVDREERPDVDRIYMKALQAMSGHGGWPMSVFLTHDLKPFYAATYIPPVPRHGIPGFRDIVMAIGKVWKNEREKITQSSEQIFEHLQRSVSTTLPQQKLSGEILHNGFRKIKESFDPINGGFGEAPKFPSPVLFNFLHRYYVRTGEKEASDMTLFTLRKMAHGGIYDHVGGGFHRYATDANWHVPHFEKMLYDQAQLINSYIDAYLISKNNSYAGVAKDVLHYVKRVMTSPVGGFYSAEDAESALDPDRPDEKEEGAFYVWRHSEIGSILTPDEMEIAKTYFGLRENGNVEADPHGVFTGRNILSVSAGIDVLAFDSGKNEDEIEKAISTISKKLFDARENRPKPHLDDKILVSWNGLMISACARAYQAFDNRDYLQSAENAVRFVLDNLYDAESRTLLRRYRDGESMIEANLEDYAFLIQSLIDLYESSFDVKMLDTALHLTEDMITLFYDNDNGGFFDTSGKDPSIILRSKEWHDGAEPSGNSIAIQNLLRLSHIFDRDDYREKAIKSLAYFGELMDKAPQALAQFLAVLDLALTKPKQIVIAGSPDAPGTREMLNEVHTRFIPHKVVLLADGGAGQEYLASKVEFLRTTNQINGKPTAYVCENYTCRLPVNDVETLRKLLEP